jgi:hypothetical protein
MAASRSCPPIRVSAKDPTPGLLGRMGLLGNPEQCVDLVYMRATENNPVGLYSCAGLGNTGAADKGINWPLVNVTA